MNMYIGKGGDFSSRAPPSTLRRGLGALNMRAIKLCTDINFVGTNTVSDGLGKFYHSGLVAIF
jgi:hypothetical protein